jgi:hypothetical protein
MATVDEVRPVLAADASFAETQLVLDLLRPFDPPVDPVSVTVSSADFKHFFKKWPEPTSTSPSRKHLGHYKALISPAIAFDETLSPIASKIIATHVTLLNIAATHGNPFARWLAIVSVMIENKKTRLQLRVPNISRSALAIPQYTICD